MPTTLIEGSIRSRKIAQSPPCQIGTAASARQGWIAYWLLSGGNDSASFVGIVVAWIVVMLAWLAVVIYAGLDGFFLKHTNKLSNLIGVGIVVTIAVAMFGLLPASREGLQDAARNTNDLQLIYIHVLRLLAVGTIIKYLHRELPLHFVILGFIPDFLVAVSAVVLAVVGSSGPLNHGFLLVWHLIGFSVFSVPVSRCSSPFHRRCAFTTSSQTPQSSFNSRCFWHRILPCHCS